jgi:hypothetical protein
MPQGCMCRSSSSAMISMPRVCEDYKIGNSGPQFGMDLYVGHHVSSEQWYR